MDIKRMAYSLVSLFLIFFLVPDTFAQQEQVAVNSFKKRVAIFEKFFISEPLLMEKQESQESPSGFIFFYSKFKNCKISFDIKKTDSLISPFMAYILVNYPNILSYNCGDMKGAFDSKYFSTIEAARNNKNNESCYKESGIGGGESTDKFIFAYQNSKWIFKEVLFEHNSKPSPWLEAVFTGKISNGRYYVEDNAFWKVLIK